MAAASSGCVVAEPLAQELRPAQQNSEHEVAREHDAGQARLELRRQRELDVREARGHSLVTALERRRANRTDGAVSRKRR